MDSTPAEILQLARQLLAEHGLADWNVELIDSRRYHGRCWKGRKLIQLCRSDVFNRKADFVRDTILHEIAHALCPKFGHCKEWRDIAYRIGVRDPIYHRYNLRAKHRKPASPTDFGKKLAHAEAHIKKLTTRMKRLETSLKKWNRRAKLYQARLSRSGNQ